MIPFLPSYIPPDVDMDQVKADVADDGVSVPPADAADVPAHSWAPMSSHKNHNCNISHRFHGTSHLTLKKL